MNLYGWSKHLFDLAVAERVARREKLPPQWAGLKFFNVFGPNEYHKGTMMSVLARRFADIKAGRPVQLFKSHRDGIADGDQRRDFIYVDDVVRVMMWLLATPSVSGLFNVGTGTARSFKLCVAGAGAAVCGPGDGRPDRQGDACRERRHPRASGVAHQDDDALHRLLDEYPARSLCSLDSEGDVCLQHAASEPLLRLGLEGPARRSEVR